MWNTQRGGACMALMRTSLKHSMLDSVENVLEIVCDNVIKNRFCRHFRKRSWEWVFDRLAQRCPFRDNNRELILYLRCLCRESMIACTIAVYLRDSNFVAFGIPYTTPPTIDKLRSKGVAIYARVWHFRILRACQKSIEWTWVEPFEMEGRLSEDRISTSITRAALLQYLRSLKG